MIFPMIFPTTAMDFPPTKDEKTWSDPSHFRGEGRGGAGPFNGPAVFMGHMGFDEEAMACMAQRSSDHPLKLVSEWRTKTNWVAIS